jgi:dienelactone hydrolase
MKTLQRTVVACSAVCLVGASSTSSPAQAKIRTAFVDYRDGATVLQGYLAVDDSRKGRRPGILVIHEWKGLDGYVQRRAREVAALGYVAFAPDIYGKGVRPKNAEEAGREAGKYRADPALLRRRARAGLQVLQRRPDVDSKRLGSMGYCFGGGASLELARSGAPVRGVVSFHRNLATKQPQDARAIRGRVLVLHGAADPLVPPKQVAAFKAEMAAARKPYKLVAYPRAVHGFTNPENAKNPTPAVNYDARADRLSWAEMKRFWAQVFAR